MNEILHKIDLSLRACLKGQEDLKIVIRWWGILAYALFYLVVDTVILKVHYHFLDLMLSWIGVIYFAWHIYVVIKCSPKKPKLTAEEKKKIREERWHNAPRSFMRKLLLQEPISKWNPVAMTVAADLLFFTNFMGYIIH